MYYYGNTGYYGGYGAGYGTGYGTCGVAPYTGYAYGGGAAIWIVLFILLVIIIGAGLGFNNDHKRDSDHC